MGIFDKIFGNKLSDDPDERYKQVRELNSNNTLKDVAKNDSNIDVRDAALRNPNLTDTTFLTDIITSERNEYLRVAAICNPNFNNKSVLAHVAKNDPSDYVRITAIEMIDDTFVLGDIMNNGPDFATRLAAEKRLKKVLNYNG